MTSIFNFKSPGYNLDDCSVLYGSDVGYEFANGRSAKAQTGWQSQPKFEQTDASITSENLNNDGLEESSNFKGPFGYFKTDDEYHYSFFADEGATRMMEKTYATEVYENDKWIIYTVGCFRATLCSESGLYAYEKTPRTSLPGDLLILQGINDSNSYNDISIRYVYTLEASDSYSPLYSCDLRSPNKSKTIVLESDGLKLIDFDTGTVSLLATTEETTDGIWQFGYAEAGCSLTEENVQWVDDTTVSVEMLKHKTLNEIVDRKQITINVKEL